MRGLTSARLGQFVVVVGRLNDFGLVARDQSSLVVSLSLLSCQLLGFRSGSCLHPEERWTDK